MRNNNSVDMGSIVVAVLLFAGYHYLNILLAKWNVAIVWHRMAIGKKKQIEHFWWGLGYFLICLPQYWAVNGWFFVAVLIPHLSVFGPYYSHYRGLAPFNLSKTSAAITEKIMVRMKLKDTEGVCIVAEIISIILFIKSIL